MKVPNKIKQCFKGYEKTIREEPLKFYLGLGTLCLYSTLHFIFDFSLLAQILLGIALGFFYLALFIEIVGIALGVWKPFRKAEIEQPSELILKFKKEEKEISYYKVNTPNLKESFEMTLSSKKFITEDLRDNSCFRIKLEKKEKT